MLEGVLKKLLLNRVNEVIEELELSQDFKEVFDKLKTLLNEIETAWEEFISNERAITELSYTFSKAHRQHVSIFKKQLFNILKIPMEIFNEQFSLNSKYKDTHTYEYSYNDNPDSYNSKFSNNIISKKMKLFSSIRYDIEYTMYYVINSNKSVQLIVDKDFKVIFDQVFPGVDFKEISMNLDEDRLRKLYLKGVPRYSLDNLFSLDSFINSNLKSKGRNVMLVASIKRAREENITKGINELSHLLSQLYKIKNITLQRQFGFDNRNSYSFLIESSTINLIIKLLEKNIERLNSGFPSGIFYVTLMLYFDQRINKDEIKHIISSHWESHEGNMLSITEDNWQNIWTSEELSMILGPPIEEKPGIKIYTYNNFSTNFTYTAGDYIKLGNIIFMESILNEEYKLPLSAINKHIFICGITGSGKTTTLKFLLNELWGKRKIPFLIIEPAKSEYYAFIQKVNGIYIDPIKDNIVINFLKPPQGIDPLIHADYVKLIFMANFSLPPFHSALLENSLYYFYTQNDKYTIDRLIKIILEQLKKLDLPQESENEVRASFVTRLYNLTRGYKGNLFMSSSTSKEVDFKALLTKPTVINLSNIAADFEKGLIMGLILTYVYEYNQLKKGSNNLNHVTVIEEAHRILGKNIISASSITQNSASQGSVEVAQSFFSNLLAEIRAYGEGIVVAEQLPSNIADDIIKQTGTKIIHKLVDLNDRKLVGDSIGLENQKMKDLILLKPGEAIIFSENTDSPIKIRIPNTLL